LSKNCLDKALNSVLITKLGN